MIQKPLLSIIIPTLNEAVHIEALLRLLSNRPDIEVIVSDGGSQDATVQVCQALNYATVIGPPNRGEQLNRGASLAAASVFLFLHADSRPDMALIEQVLEATNTGFPWGCGTIVFDHQALFYRLLALSSTWRARFFNSCYGDQAIFCTRDMFETLEGFPAWPLFEDIGFSRRARRLTRARILSATVNTSPRRYETGGRWRTFLYSQWLKLLFVLGISPARLAAMYNNRKGTEHAGCRHYNEQNSQAGVQ